MKCSFYRYLRSDTDLITQWLGRILTMDNSFQVHLHSAKCVHWKNVSSYYSLCCSPDHTKNSKQYIVIAFMWRCGAERATKKMTTTTIQNKHLTRHRLKSHSQSFMHFRNHSAEKRKLTCTFCKWIGNILHVSHGKRNYIIENPIRMFMT